MKPTRRILHTSIAFVSVAIIFVFIALVSVVAKDYLQSSQPTPLPTSAPTPTVTPALTPTPTSSPEPTTISLPESVLLQVPFLLQAPRHIWDDLHNETCEEASLLMVKHFIDKTPLADSEAGRDEEIIDLVHYEEVAGYPVDVTTAQVSEIAARHWGMQSGRVVGNISIEAIKHELAAGRPVIVPAAGRMLPNPYFRAPRPPYHMLVIIGYDADGFITNDPGVGRGAKFHYTFDSLYQAIHDWTGNKDTIAQGQKVYLVFD